MVRSAGLVLILQLGNNFRVLLAHPTNAAWYKTYSIPKGIVQDEDILDTAIRETKEEVGISINKEDVINNPLKIFYYDKEKIPVKEINYFIVFIKDLKTIGLSSDVVPPLNLQKEEVDWAGFLSIEEARKRILNKQLPILIQAEKFWEDWKNRG